MMSIDFFITKSYYKLLFNCNKLIQIREFTEINTPINISREAIPTQVLSIKTDHGRPWSTMVDHGRPWCYVQP